MMRIQTKMWNQNLPIHPRYRGFDPSMTGVATAETGSTRGGRGITVIEVLTSIVVAMIGVFGVMILIPFAVQQAQLGLDRDEASVVGRNAFARFEIEGFHQVDNAGLTRWRSSAGNLWLDRTAAPNTAGVYVIDPLAVTEAGRLAAPPQPELFGVFPDVDFPPAVPPPVVEFPQLNLTDINGNPFTVALAREMFRTSDDLVFADPLPAITDTTDPLYPDPIFRTGLGPPQQVFDTDGAGVNLRRQIWGRMSWNAVVVPVKNRYISGTPTTRGLKFDMHLLVHKDRDLIPDPVTGLAPQYECRPLDNTGSNVGVSFGGGTITLETGQVFTDVRKDDWVMLVNQAVGGEPGFDMQVAFYRVIGIHIFVPPLGPPNSEVMTLTLDGADFDFGDPSVPTHSQTYAVHLVQLDANGRRRGRVVNVYERTLRWEGKSNWN